LLPSFLVFDPNHNFSLVAFLNKRDYNFKIPCKSKSPSTCENGCFNPLQPTISIPIFETSLSHAFASAEMQTFEQQPCANLQI
jgi:hypothetical protein